MRIYLQDSDVLSPKGNWMACAGPFPSLELALDAASDLLERSDHPVKTIRAIVEVPRFSDDVNPINVVLISPTDLLLAAWQRREFLRLLALLAPAGGSMVASGPLGTESWPPGTHGDHRSERNAAAAELRQLGDQLWSEAKKYEGAGKGGDSWDAPLKAIADRIHAIAAKLEG